MSEWEVEMKKVNSLNRYIKKNNDFIRMFMAGVRMVDVDETGRLLIPKDLASITGISKDLVLSSAVNYIEIWDKDLYETSISSNTIDFSLLAEEVMGNLDKE